MITEHTMRDTTLAEAESEFRQATADMVDTQDASKGELFSGAAFETDAARFDNLKADAVKISFGGGVTLEADDELFADLTLGSDFQFVVSGKVVGKTGAYKEDAEGEITVVGTAKLKIDSITVE